MEKTRALVPNPASNVNEMLAVIEEFFSRVDAGTLFHSDDDVLYYTMRGELLEALYSLLVWQRPALEATRGIKWLYEGFARRRHIFKEVVDGGGAGWARKQAELFLAFLPFPGQWSWMKKAEAHYGNDSEIKDFLANERREILRKIRGKPQRHYKLRHFCQVLKRAEPGGTKGILRIFSLPYLFTQYGLLPALSRRYVIFVEPPMGIVCRHVWWRHFAGLEDPCVMGVSSAEDVLFLKGQHWIEPVQLAHGDFLEETDPRQETRPANQFDIVFNSTFDEMDRKRHDLMLRLLLHPLLQKTKALFLGRGSRTNVEMFKNRVFQYGLGSRVTVMANLRRAEVPAWLGLCRTGVHLSLYENACRCVYEFFRSNLPCVISSSMGGMNLDIFNEHTGMAVADDDLPEAISFVLSHSEKYEPRQWFLNHSGSRNSSPKLNEVLKRLFEKWGYEWCGDIVPLASSGASRYLDPSVYEHFTADFEWILECFQSAADQSLTFSVE